jgi:hypothetical protein
MLAVSDCSCFELFFIMTVKTELFRLITEQWLDAGAMRMVAG